MLYTELKLSEVYFFSLVSWILTGIRTEQDLYVRLIDSMTKQVTHILTHTHRYTHFSFSHCHLSCYLPDNELLHWSACTLPPSSFFMFSRTQKHLCMSRCGAVGGCLLSVYVCVCVCGWGHTQTYTAWLQAFSHVLLSLWLERGGSEEQGQNAAAAHRSKWKRYNGTSGIWSAEQRVLSDRIQFFC